MNMCAHGPAWPVPSSTTDDELVVRVLGGEPQIFEALMRRHNRRLYRAIRAILGGDHEVEDVMQEAWLRAYSHLQGFERRSSFATWATRIAVYEALGRLRKRRTFAAATRRFASADTAPVPDPEHVAAGGELLRTLELKIDDLPEPFRAVLVLRLVEGLSVEETAECLALAPDTVKSRLHRARSALQRELGSEAAELFEFHLDRCDRVVFRVFDRLGWTRPTPAYIDGASPPAK